MVETSDDNTKKKKNDGDAQPNFDASTTSGSLKRKVLLVAIFGQFMAPFDSAVVALGLKAMGTDLGGNVTSLSWVITGFLIVLATFSLSSGRLADIYGRKNTYSLGIIIFIVSSALCGFAFSVDELIAMRLVQGLGASMMSGNALALLSTFYPANERGRAFGITSASVYTGLSVGPPVGGLLIQYVGWRSIFFVNVPVGIVVLVITLFFIRGELPKGKMEKFDIRGAIIYGSAISLLLVGLSYLGSVSSIALPVLIIGIVCLFGFILLESRIEHPLLDLKLFFKNRLFTFTVLSTFLNQASTFGLTVVLALYLEIGLGYGSAFSGLILLAQPLFMVITAPIGGYLADRVEPRYQTSISLTVICMAIFSLSRLGPTSTPLGIAVPLCLLGVGFGFFSPANSNAAFGTVEKPRYGIASGILATMRFTGQAVGLAVVTYVLSAVLHQNASDSASLQLVPHDLIISASRAALFGLGVLAAIAILASLVRGKRKQEKITTE